MADIKTIIKKIEYNNPLAVSRRKKMRTRLNNSEITLLVPNCLGGILFHDLNLEFMSPTVNLMMTQTDFVKLVNNLDCYLREDFRFYKHEEYSCPCAYLKDLSIHFTHFQTESEAEEAWHRRAGRINRNNLFICCMERDGLSKEDILSLAELEVKGIVVFTAHDYEDIPYTVFVPGCIKDGQVDNLLKKEYLTDQREYEKYFDFVAWFNEAAGPDYDVSKFTY